MKDKKSWRLLIVSAFLFFLAGCMEPVELSKIGVVAGLGIDKYQGNYLVTLQIMNPAGITGENPNALPVYSVHAMGETLLTATNALSNMSTQVLFYSHLKAVVINEDIVREEGLDDIIDFLMRNPEIRPDVTLLIAKDTTAKDVLNVITAVEQVPMNKLDALTNINRRRTGMVSSFNLYEVMNRLHTPGSTVALNMVSIRSEEEHLPHQQEDEHEADHLKQVKEGEKKIAKSQLEEPGDSKEEVADATENEGSVENEKPSTPGNEGPTKQNMEEITPPSDIKIENIAVFKGSKMIGDLNSMEAQMYNLLLGQHKRYWGRVDLNGGEYFAVMQITSIEATTQAFIQEKKASIELSVRGELLEGNYPMNVDNQHNLRELEKKFEEDIQTKAMAFLKRTQEEFKTDVSDIGISAYFSNHKEWEKVSTEWDDIYPTLNIDVKCHVDVYSTGEIKNNHNLR